MLRELMLQDVDHERQDIAEKNLEIKLQEHVDACNYSQRLLNALQKDKDKLDEKMEEVKANAKEISTKKESLHKSLDIAILLQKELEKQVLKLNNRMVPTYGIYLELSKEKVSFLRT